MAAFFLSQIQQWLVTKNIFKKKKTKINNILKFDQKTKQEFSLNKYKLFSILFVIYIYI